MNLLPPDDIQVNGQKHGDYVSGAMHDMAVASLLQLYVSIDNGTDKDCVMAWVREYINTGKDIPSTKVRDVIKNIYKELANVHIQFVASRRQND